MGTGMNRRSFLKGSLLGAFFAAAWARHCPVSAQSKTRKRSAMFFRKGENLTVNCELCFRRCLILDGKRGFCRVRVNEKGELRSLVYGRPVGLQIDPIELEPMYHMAPGHKNLCVYTASCNFRCKHCHNWTISQSSPEEVIALERTPSEVVEEALRQGCQSISHSINEPTVLYEFMYDIVRLSRQKGLLTLCHTNGGISKAPVTELLKYLDGVTVDLKSFNPRFYQEISEARIEPVLETLKTIKGAGKHLEIVNLIIPALNDDMNDIKEMCRWIARELGKDIPLHLTRFSPSYKLTHLPRTPIATLEKAREIALHEGLKYVYVGNVVGHPANSTYCPKCGRRLIERSHFIVLKNDVQKGRCPSCNERLPGIWR